MRHARATQRRNLPAGQCFGAHVSVAGGLHRAFERARLAGCDCLQVFVKNQRQWSSRPLDDEQVQLWDRAARRGGIRPVFAHSTYLINLAAPDAALWAKSIAAFADELLRCAKLGIVGLIVHPGSHRGAGDAAGIRRVARALDRVAEITGAVKTHVVLETAAGQGTALGWRFEQLAEIVERTRSPARVGVCLDTCHVFAAGYDLRTQPAYDRTIAELDRLVGLRRLACCHLNDSLGELGSRVDRHAGIGQGKLGRSAFKRLVNDPRLAHVPKIIETPKGTDHKGRDLDRLNIARLRRMVGRTP